MRRRWHRGLRAALGVTAGLCAMLVACGRSITDSASSTALVPLRVGTSWQYHAADSTSGQPIPNDRIVPDSDFTVTVLRDTLDVNGASWAVVDNFQELFGFLAEGSGVYFANISGGLRELVVTPHSGGPTTAFTNLILYFPASLGELTLGGPVVSALDTVVTVPAGTYHCVRYDLVDEPNPGPITYWTVFAAPGVGVVKRIANEASFQDGQLHVTGTRQRVSVLVAVHGT